MFQYFKDHPHEAYTRSNVLLQKAFPDDDPTLLSKYKSHYVDEVTGFWENKNKKNSVNRRKKRKEVTFPRYEEMVKCPHCPGAYANEVMKFVGFRGRIEKHRHPKGGMVEQAVLDIQGEEHRGEARPEPIVPVSAKRNLDNLMRLTGLTKEELGRRFYVGILEYEVAVMTLLFTLEGMGYEDVMVLIARGQGKTFMNSWGAQIDMKWFHQNQLLFSETSARLKVANWVYLWAFHNEYLKEPEKYARKSTYQHFELVEDIRMDIYKYSKEEMVGEHDYKLRLDDTVKKKWQRKPTENEKMNEHWDSNLNFIIRTGTVDFGTRKYEGDPLQHRMDTIEDLVVITMSPFIRCPHDNINVKGTFDPCPICRDECLLAPEIHGYTGLMQKMESNYESWFSEMMQDPHPRKGGMVEEEDIVYVQRPFFTECKLLGIGVDVARVWEDTTLSDMTAVISCVMTSEMDNKKEEHRKFTFMTEDVRRMPFRTTKDVKGRVVRGIIETIDKLCEWFKKDFPHVPFIIAIERSGGGITLIDQIMRERWWWVKHIIADKGKAVKWDREGRANVPLGIKHTTEKIPRVSAELRHSIKQKQTRFTQNLEDTTFMTQLLSFPKGKHDDGPDAAGMIKDELNRRWSKQIKPRPHEDPHITRLKEQSKKAFNYMAQPWMKVRDQAIKNAQRKERFKKRPPF